MDSDAPATPSERGRAAPVPAAARPPTRSRSPPGRGRGRRPRPPAPVRPARAQRLVLGAVGRPAHLACSATGSTSSRCVPVVRDRPARALAVGARLLRRDAAEPAPQPDRGTFVDRWDHKEVMVVSDILRAALVLLIPVAAVDEHLPRLPADLPRHHDLGLLPAGPGRDPAADRAGATTCSRANSAMWVGETIADVVGYPLAGVFVAFLGIGAAARVLVRRATYLASAVLLASIVGPRAVRDRRRDGGRRAGRRPERPSPSCARAGSSSAARRSSSRTRSRGGRPVRARHPDRADADRSSGDVSAAPSVGCAGRVRLPRDRRSASATSIGGFAIGLVGSRFAKGRMVIAGYVAVGRPASSCSR